MIPVLRHVIEAIGPASAVHRREAMRRLARVGPMFDRLGGALAAAQHGPPHAGHRTLVVVAGDHGAGDPGIAMGAEHPTVIAAHAIDRGDAALRQLARSARAELLLLDCGCTESAHLPPGAVRLGRHPGGDAREAAALTVVEAQRAMEAGIAVAVSLLDAGTDVLALGAIGLGAEVGAAAIAGALLGSGAIQGQERELAAFAHRHAEHTGLDPLGVLAAFGGPETAALVGLILAAASMNLPVILDGEATGAAALVAARLAPAVTGYLIASQRGNGCMPLFVEALQLDCVFAGGVGHGEGAGAAMVLGLLDQVLGTWGQAPRS